MKTIFFAIALSILSGASFAHDSGGKQEKYFARYCSLELEYSEVEDVECMEDRPEPRLEQRPSEQNHKYEQTETKAPSCEEVNENLYECQQQ